MFIHCHCLDDSQTPPAVKRVCAAKNNAAMQMDEEEESKFDDAQNHVMFFSFNLDSLTWKERFQKKANVRSHDRCIAVGGDQKLCV